MGPFVQILQAVLILAVDFKSCSISLTAYFLIVDQVSVRGRERRGTARYKIRLAFHGLLWLLLLFFYLNSFILIKKGASWENLFDYLSTFVVVAIKCALQLFHFIHQLIDLFPYLVLLLLKFRAQCIFGNFWGWFVALLHSRANKSIFIDWNALVHRIILSSRQILLCLPIFLVLAWPRIDCIESSALVL